MTRKPLWRAGVALVMVAAMMLPGAAVMAQEGTVVAEGFNAPQGVLVAPDGSFWVADSGVGGDQQIVATDPATSETVTVTVGNTARIVQVMPDGTQNVAAELPSFNAGFDTAGAARLALLNDELYATTGWWMPAMGEEPGPDQAVIIKVGADEVSEVAKLWRTEKRMNPDNAQIDSHPYGLATGPDGKLWVVDAGGNDLLRVDPATNTVEWLSTFAPIEGVFPNPNLGGEMLTDAVPTGIAFDADGNAYITLLGGAPFVPGTSKVVKVGPNGGAAADYATGLTMLTDIKRAPDGNLYAVQIGEFTDQGPVPNSGQIIQIAEGDASTPVVSGLSFPTSIDFAANGDAYVTINGVGEPGSGAVVMYAGLGAPKAEEEAPALMDIVDTAAGNEDLSTLVAALSAAGLAEELKKEGPYTVFAPTNEAFAALPEGTLDALLADPAGDLTQILLYHVVPGAVTSADVTDGLEATTAQGSPVTFSMADGNVMVNDANVVGADIEATNGVIHVIDKVLMPATEGEAAAAAEATPTPAAEEEAAPAEEASVTVEDQESDGTQVTVASVAAPENAWLVIESDADGKPGQVLGTTAVPAGTTENVVVILDTPIAGENHLWAMLHKDAGEAGVWEFPNGPDEPMMAGDEMVMAPFTVTAPGGEAAAEATVAPTEEAAAEATAVPTEEAVAEATAVPAEEAAAAAPAEMPSTGAAGMGGMTSMAVVTLVLAGLAVGTFAVRRRKW